MTKDSTTLTEIPGYTFVNPRRRQVAALMTYIDVQIASAAGTFTRDQLGRNKREVIAILQGDQL